MSLQATEATVVTLGEDNAIIRCVIFIQSAWPIYVIQSVWCTSNTHRVCDTRPHEGGHRHAQ